MTNLLDACVTDLRSAIAVSKLQNNRTWISVPPTVFAKIREELKAEDIALKAALPTDIMIFERGGKLVRIEMTGHWYSYT